jgi:hypothetical protein
MSAGASKWAVTVPVWWLSMDVMAAAFGRLHEHRHGFDVP